MSEANASSIQNKNTLPAQKHEKPTCTEQRTTTPPRDHHIANVSHTNAENRGVHKMREERRETRKEKREKHKDKPSKSTKKNKGG